MLVAVPTATTVKVAHVGAPPPFDVSTCPDDPIVVNDVAFALL